VHHIAAHLQPARGAKAVAAAQRERVAQGKAAAFYEGMESGLGQMGLCADFVGRQAVQERLPSESWDVALVFSEPLGQTTLVIDLDRAGGGLAAVGQPGRIGLGRIGPGLEKWIRSTLAASP
jgi:hypothetical protein